MITAYQCLLLLRLVELGFMSAIFSWLVWYFPPSRLRNIRLALALGLISLNLAAIVVAVGWAHIALW